MLPTKSRHPQETLDVVLIVKLSKKLWEENHQVQFRNHPSCSVARDKNFVLCLLGPTNINDKLTVGWYHQQIFFQRFSFPEYFANYVIQIMLHQKTLIRGSISNISNAVLWMNNAHAFLPKIFFTSNIQIQLMRKSNEDILKQYMHNPLTFSKRK